MIPNIGGTELLILLAVVLLLFGAKRIPELAKGLGSGVREFKRGVSGRFDAPNEVAERGGETRAAAQDG
jgi:sec-independent protein translocase protein TatA